jgi:hypothetical protein
MTMHTVLNAVGLGALLVLLGGTQPAMAGDVDRYELEAGLTRLEFAGPGRLALKLGADNRLTVSGPRDERERVVVDQDGDTLRIGTDQGRWSWRDRDELRFVLELTSVDALAFIELSGSGDLVAGQLAPKEISLRLTGSGDVRIDRLETGPLHVAVSGSGDVEIAQMASRVQDVSISGSGDIELAGTTGLQQVSVTGSGDYRAADLSSRVARVSVAGSGNVEVFVQDRLDVTIVGSGDVRYGGRPQLSTSIRGSGEVRRR